MKYVWLLASLCWMVSGISYGVTGLVRGGLDLAQTNLRIAFAVACLGMFYMSRLHERLKKLDGLDY